MKMLVHRALDEETPPFYLEHVMGHVRASDGTEREAVERAAWAAAHEIEQFAQIALLTQTIRVTIFDPLCQSGLRLPVGPVDEDDVPTVLIDGVAFTAFHFAGGNRPYIHWQADCFDLTPSRMTIEYQAGFGPAADAIPPDLAQALMDQAALHYDGRSPMDARALAMSPHMSRIGARYRGVQI